jgi:hypothetical protein
MVLRIERVWLDEIVYRKNYSFDVETDNKEIYLNPLFAMTAMKARDSDTQLVELKVSQDSEGVPIGFDITMMATFSEKITDKNSVSAAYQLLPLIQMAVASLTSMPMDSYPPVLLPIHLLTEERLREKMTIEINDEN